MSPRVAPGMYLCGHRVPPKAGLVGDPRQGDVARLGGGAPATGPAGASPRLELWRATLQIKLEGASFAAGTAPAEFLSDADQEAMVLVEERRVTRQVGHEESLKLLVARLGGDKPMAGEDSARVRVHDKDRVVARIEQDGVRRLGADTGDPQQLGTDRREWPGEHSPEASTVVAPEVLDERLEPPRLDPKVARGTERPRQFSKWNPGEGGRREEAGALEIGNRPFDVDPGGILGEDGPDGHLELALSGPPVLGAQDGEGGIVETEKTVAKTTAWRHGGILHWLPGSSR